MASGMERESHLQVIRKHCDALEARYRDRFSPLRSLGRAKAASQGNRTYPMDRWYRYKEAFSVALINHLMGVCGLTEGTLLDPFAGAGTSLFAASRHGMDADGIELLPVGQELIRARIRLEGEFTERHGRILADIAERQVWKTFSDRRPVPELGITRGAYPAATLDGMERYLALCEHSDEPLRTALRLALLAVLETVSFTRKDGQYLRWDRRSGRKPGKRPFDKGTVPPFDCAIRQKIHEICSDLQHCRTGQGAAAGLFTEVSRPGTVTLYPGSCLKVLPELAAESHTAVITSPPYCNRYDYTRIYALELALLGVDEAGVKNLRQEMLSCTVENRAKHLTGRYPHWDRALSLAGNHELLQSLLDYLEDERQRAGLNNNALPRMIRGYFHEMAVVIAECARILRAGGHLVMVNDNVRYAGVSIPVDTILSSLAESLGFSVRNILVLPTAKGNSSQQMGAYGRIPLRKSIYIWQRM